MKYITSLSLLLVSTAVYPETVTLSVNHALETASDSVGIPESVLKALCWVESRHNPKALNQYDGGSPSYGLCQIKFKTARSLKYRGPVSGLYDPYINSHLAAKYLHYQFKRYNGNWVKAISAYSRGNAKALNSEYVNKVIKRMVSQ